MQINTYWLSRIRQCIHCHAAIHPVFSIFKFIDLILHRLKFAIKFWFTCFVWIYLLGRTEKLAIRADSMKHFSVETKRNSLRGNFKGFRCTSIIYLSGVIWNIRIPSSLKISKYPAFLTWNFACCDVYSKLRISIGIGNTMNFVTL